ncbi:ABC transporter permease [Thermoflavimicrobium daqui]|uniref:ABC transporter permease n=1 Tax=Thermoflavimicrobium daqui TaxID=2137476 RepID=A0A364K8Y2_9BACL|nr:ABC transporter permease [Thermoflavimicrobium daqui]RAL26660.1 hypothetical protein DL897_01010 [Thermoflavimicrobium daqui]
MKTDQLFIKRMTTSWTQAIRILMMVLSGGGTPLVVGVLFILLSIAYSRFLVWLPKDFPIAVLVAIIISLPLSIVRIRTWIQKADLTFLLPLETKMRDYFKVSLYYNCATYLARLTLFLLILLPLYRLRFGTIKDFMAVLIAFCFLQVWNIIASWLEDRLQPFYSSRFIFTLFFIRLLITGWLSYITLIYVHAKISLVLLFFILTVLHTFFLWRIFSKAPRFPYPWILFAKREQKIQAKYVSLAGWFVDLPQVRFPVKERKWITWLLPKLIPQGKPFSYLYWRTFFRHSELFSIYLRILLLAILIIVFLPNFWVVFGTILLCIWLFGSQLPQITNPHRYPMFVQIYPIDPKERRTSFQKMCWILISLLSIILTLVASFTNLLLSQVLGIGITALLISFFFSNFYLPRKIEKRP